MEIEINKFSIILLCNTFFSINYFVGIFGFGFWDLKAFHAFSVPRGELQDFFCFLLQHFLFSLSRVLFARCVLPLYCVQLLCGLFYIIKAFSVMHGTDFCASSPYSYIFHGLIQPWRNFFLLSVTLPFFYCINSCLKAY